MIITRRCQHCGNKSQVEDMGDNCICPVCNRFVFSMSEELRQQVLGPGSHNQGE